MCFFKITIRGAMNLVFVCHQNPFPYAICDSKMISRPTDPVYSTNRASIKSKTDICEKKCAKKSLA